MPSGVTMGLKSVSWVAAPRADAARAVRREVQTTSTDYDRVDLVRLRVDGGGRTSARDHLPSMRLLRQMSVAPMPAG